MNFHLHFLCAGTVKALARLHGCAGLSEPVGGGGGFFGVQNFEFQFLGEFSEK